MDSEALVQQLFPDYSHFTMGDNCINFHKRNRVEADIIQPPPDLTIVSKADNGASGDEVNFGFNLSQAPNRWWRTIFDRIRKENPVRVFFDGKIMKLVIPAVDLPKLQEYVDGIKADLTLANVTYRNVYELVTQKAQRKVQGDQEEKAKQKLLDEQAKAAFDDLKI